MVKLKPNLEMVLNEYLKICKEVYSETQQRNIRFRCTSFLKFIQNRGLADTSDLRYEDILAYHEDVPHVNRIDRMLYESSIKPFLSHLAEKGICSPGLGWFLHYLQDDRIVAAEAVANIYNEILDSTETNSLQLSSKKYRDLYEVLLSILKEEQLGGGLITIYETAFKLHFIYLDMNGFDYSLTRAIAWADAVKGIFKSAWPTVRRAIRLFDDYAKAGVLIPGKSYTSKPNAFDLLPEWCKNPINEFVRQREKTMMSPSTIHMDLATCARFCSFLSEEGIASFRELTAAAVKDFNIKDRHQSAGGKGAYNSRLRRFLKFLARKGYVANTSLYQSLGGPAASSEHIVVTLNETEKENLKTFNASAESELEQRDKACILLGTEMGIRGCDIVNLKFGDINWKDRSICFQQLKTGTEVRLGHKSPDETFYYYHQVLEAFSVIRNKDTVANNVIPEARVR